jgi:hypothetical protein
MIKMNSNKIGKEEYELKKEVTELSVKYLLPTGNILSEKIVEVEADLQNRDLSEEKKARIFYNTVGALIIGILQASKLRIEDAVYLSKDVYKTLEDQQFYIDYEKKKECDNFQECLTQKIMAKANALK